MIVHLTDNNTQSVLVALPNHMWSGKVVAVEHHASLTIPVCPQCGSDESMRKTHVITEHITHALTRQYYLYRCEDCGKEAGVMQPYDDRNV